VGRSVPIGSLAVIVPDDLRYSNDHEWARAGGTRVRVGITDYAQDALGDVVFVDLPALGAEVEAGSVLGEVESTKSVSEIYAPVAGRVVEVNAALADAPEKMNEDPYGEGWICDIELADAASLEGLLDSAAYRQLIET
jgi:glycine cleavage system H protein